MFKSLRDFSLAIAPTELSRLEMSLMQAEKVLATFLNTLPRTLEALALTLPSNKVPDGDGLRSWRASSPLFGDYGFKGLLENAEPLPSLSSLHLRNFTFIDADLLRSFLLRRTPSVRSLSLTDVALRASHWRPFIDSLGREMKLDILEMANNMRSEERRIQDALWDSSPAHQRPRRADYESAAKTALVNGVRMQRRLPENNVSEQGYEAGEEDEVDGEVGGSAQPLV